MPSATIAAAPAAPAALLGGPAPLYYQLSQAIRDRISAGEWKAGDQIPTIKVLGETYGVSRITVVQALDALSREGLLARRQGKGVFVAQTRVEQGPVRLVSFTEETVRRGHVPASRTLSLTTQPASSEVATHLGLEPGKPVVVIERMRLADGQPMGIQTAYLPEHLFPGLAETTGPIVSLYRLLEERYGVVPTQATDTFVPIKLDRERAALLAVPVDAPAFSVERVTRDQRDRSIEFVVSVLRGDRYKVVLHLTRGSGL